MPPLKARDAGNEEEEGSEGMEGVEGNLNLNVDVPTTLVTAVRPGNTDALVWEGERNKGR